MSEAIMDKTIKVGKETAIYGDDRRNYIAPCEITVTITLHEYRDLVEKNASHEKKISEIREDYEIRIRKLTEDLTFHKAQVERLKEELSPKSDSDSY